VTAIGVTALLATEAGLVPTLFVAVTVKVYSVPFVRFETTHDKDVLETTVTVHEPPAGDDVAVKEEIAAPPLLAGVVHRTEARESPATADTEAGASGAVG
jgi:hypothetical protein